MRRFLSLILALVAGLFVLGVPSAVAGGPTSVLLVNYESGRSAAALNGSTAYADLQSILGDENPPAGASRPAGVSESDNATVRMVWLIHDVSPWRIDNVYVQDKDVWVETYFDTSGTDPHAATPVWHQPARGADLTKVLTTLGVVGAGSSANGAAASVGPVTQEVADPTASEPATAGAPWWLAATLGAVGLALGAILGRRATPRLHAPRQVTAMG
ncbi:hypothetical protein V6K52_07430 [Knoellia sp. S7-12]|uniref:hypothetical protein n=1 Tax=Knoellia sp. S7-12 TaxID=3126698 RepID=UPI0033690314